MQIRKQALIDAIDTAITTHAEAVANYAQEVDQWQRQRAEQWHAEKGPYWRALRDFLTQKIRNRTPVTFEEVTGLLPTTQYSNPVTDNAFREIDPTSKQVRPPASIPTERLKALRGALAALDDTTLSDTQLSRLGFKHVEWIFTAAVANGGEVK